MTTADDTRAALERLWCEALGRAPGTPVPDEENFFDAGGTSLAVIRLHAGLEGKFAGPVDLVRLIDLLDEESFGSVLRAVATPGTRP
ncbi:acyl carrier protein [Kitasatospora sp. NPDC058965]|uniref:acyl carrier protein n=1 Tax=Kitasatospora sp. NPDC058965 TaxID=3346682 RepID=UPI0036A90D45